MPAIISRREAHAQGLKRFYTGEPCKRGHICERFTSNGGCLRCMHFSTPNRKQGAKGTNVGWPAVGLVFNVPDIQLDEMEAAFRYMESAGWHDHAVLEMRKDPTLLDKYRTKITPKEIGEIEAKLERARRSTFVMQDAVFTLACGFGQLYYGEPKKVGDTIECNHCSTLQRITSVS